jgi:hypothetical protein
MVVAVEDVVGDLAVEEVVHDAETGAQRTEVRLSMDRLVEHIVELILARERRGKLYGTVVLAEGLAALAAFDRHRYAAILHRYELSNWVLYARAYARRGRKPDERTRAVDRALRAEKRGALAWLREAWITKTSST